VRVYAVVSTMGDEADRAGELHVAAVEIEASVN